MTPPFTTGNNSSGARDFFPGMVVLDTYEVKDLLGRGGMGAVYRVYHRYLQKEMAMKTLRADQVSNHSWLRFQTEAKAIAKLEHPNIIQIFDMGICENGQPFYTMELLDGMGLDEWTRRNPISIMQTLFVFRQVAGGLAFAHERGIIHRDIKPANVVLTFSQANQPPVVKLVDFGIAKLVTDAQGLTKDGEVFGSPLYISPEQATGLKVDQRSDIYSLGCALYETLTGFPPFRGKTAMETMMMHLDRSAVPIERARPEVNYPPGLSFVVQKCMTKEPDARYGNASQLVQDLLKIEQGKGEEVAAQLRQEQLPPVSSQPQANMAVVPVLALKIDENENENDRSVVDELEDYVEEGNSGGGKKRFLLIATLLVSVSIAVIFCGIFFFGRTGSEEHEVAGASSSVEPSKGKEKNAKERRDKSLKDLSRYCLSQEQYAQLVPSIPYNHNSVYFLFPEDGDKTIGAVGNISCGPKEKVQYKPASGLVELPNSLGRVTLGLKLSSAVVEQPAVLDKFRAEDVYYVAFPEAGIKKEVCEMVWRPSPQKPYEKAQRLLFYICKLFPSLGQLDTAFAPLDRTCLKKMGRMKTLVKLQLADSELADARALELLNFDVLETLTLPPLKDASGILTKLGTAPAFKELMLVKFGGSASELKALGELGKIETFACRDSQITPGLLQKVQGMRQLKSLDFAWSNLPENALPVLRDLSPRLDSLVLATDYEKARAYEELRQVYGSKLRFDGKNKLRAESLYERALPRKRGSPQPFSLDLESFQ